MDYVIRRKIMKTTWSRKLFQIKNKGNASMNLVPYLVLESDKKKSCFGMTS